MVTHDVFKDALIALIVINFVVSAPVVSSAAYMSRQKLLQENKGSEAFLGFPHRKEF